MQLSDQQLQYQMSKNLERKNTEANYEAAQDYGVNAQD